MEKLRAYLAENGILGCNTNAYIPALEDIGCAWADATALIDAHEVFCTRVWRKRTAYLSREAYYLLKQCRAQKPMEEAALCVYAVLEGTICLEKPDIQAFAQLDKKSFAKAFDFLLENMYMTAYKNGRILQENWSTFCYSTAENWEKAAPYALPDGDAEARLRALLRKTMPEKEIERLLFRDS